MVIVTFVSSVGEDVIEDEGVGGVEVGGRDATSSESMTMVLEE